MFLSKYVHLRQLTVYILAPKKPQQVDWGMVRAEAKETGCHPNQTKVLLSTDFLEDGG